MTTPAIPVTEFVLPNGAQREGSFKRSEEIAALAYKVIGAGYRFTIERLTTGEISMAVESDEGDEDIEIVPNAPGVVGEGFDRLVKRAAASLSKAEG